MIGGLSRTSRVNESICSVLYSSLMMLFSVNCETRKVIIVIRDLPSLIAVNCVHDPPTPPPSLGDLQDAVRGRAQAQFKFKE